jgi:hypothetical protein
LRIVSAAKQFILNPDSKTEDWIGKKTYRTDDLGAYKAFCLLSRESPEFLADVDSTVWEKWALTILACPIGNSGTNKNDRPNLVRLAYSKAAKGILTALESLIDYEISTRGYIFAVNDLTECWDDEVAALLLKKAKTPNLNATCLASLLDPLLSRRDERASAFAKSLITPDSLSNAKTKEQSLAAARSLVMRCCSEGWQKVWPIIQSDASLGKEIVESISYFPGDKSDFPMCLSETHLGAFYVWLVRQYPYVGSSNSGFGIISPARSVTMLRDSVLTTLKAKGTPEAIEALEGVVHDLPSLTWLRFHLLQAQTITRRHTWAPPQPEEILALPRNPQTRLVRSGKQLLDVIVESLERLQRELHGETPSVQYLWNESPEKKLRPKDENALSDFVKLHLDEDIAKRGIVINREVRIHRGQRTDIHVTALMKGQADETFDQVTAITEVKGSWNPELETAMQFQLVEKYLTDNRCRHGLYLVGWYASDSWDEADHRKNEVTDLHVDNARTQFETQANNLSKSGQSIRAFILDTSFNLKRPTHS